jgi:hypothetical protein
MSLDCPFLIACSVFSKVYLANIHYIEYKYYRYTAPFKHANLYASLQDIPHYNPTTFHRNDIPAFLVEHLRISPVSEISK